MATARPRDRRARPTVVRRRAHGRRRRRRRDQHRVTPARNEVTESPVAARTRPCIDACLPRRRRCTSPEISNERTAPAAGGRSGARVIAVGPGTPRTITDSGRPCRRPPGSPRRCPGELTCTEIAWGSSRHDREELAAEDVAEDVELMRAEVLQRVAEPADGRPRPDVARDDELCRDTLRSARRPMIRRSAPASSSAGEAHHHRAA
jgi:hypothetical protein